MERLPFLQMCRWKCGWACRTETANPSQAPTLEQVLQEAFTRREFLRGILGAAIVLGVPEWFRRAAEASGGTGVPFIPVGLSRDDRVAVPSGYLTRVVVRWGDPLFRDAPPFNPERLQPEAQATQFGYNCDFVSFLPLGRRGGDRGLLWVNHEYTNPELMFPGYPAGRPTREMVDVEIAAHGGSVVEVRAGSDGNWVYVRESRFNRRVTGETLCLMTGPAAGHEWTRTQEDPSGVRVRGTLNNCAGGVTPWGTVLTCEENFHQYFGNAGQLPADDPRRRVHARYGIPGGASERRWELHHPRFDVGREPNEPFRFGWVVEVDPYDPTFVPRKRTALGRFKHEGATVVVTRERRVVVYSGDDERFEYIYKFVSSKTFRPGDRAHNLTLLDEGTLYVARFYPDGTGEWLPLTFGNGPLTPANGFRSQADVLLNTRGAADLLGATRMDRPEDIEAHPVTGTVYAVCTNNDRRTLAQVDPANPRAVNRHGHILEIFEAGGDHAATRFRWQIFLLCGNPADPDTYFAGYPKERVSPISCPDNIVFDRVGNLWIATDGQPAALGYNDGLYVVPVSGSHRGRVWQFLSGPLGCEICGPEFTPDFRTLFVAVQHPGEGGTWERPLSRWPDGAVPPRPSVVAVRHREGREVGS
ncbi:MAG: PhoX family phosphatase [Armatimonadota bacterium]|nr:PhoX family phosphatase [Armatimonadota bacterium]MDW8156693.1 PhoX family phosphatase [Armatimonadota bacterium]